MKIADLKYQSVAPSNPSPNTLGLYADSGTSTVFTMTSGGVPRQIGITYTGSTPLARVATGMGVLLTGWVIGSGNGINPFTGMGAPYKFLPVVDSVGTPLVIPAYLTI